MENFNKNSLKAAVKVYGPLHAEGQVESYVKAALTNDEKGYSPEQVDQIYAAIIAPPAEQIVLGHVVSTEFRDKHNFSKLYAIGEDVSHLDEDRKADLLSKGLVKQIFETDNA
jgi:hypothetical protein